jgi:Peptidase family M28
MFYTSAHMRLLILLLFSISTFAQTSPFLPQDFYDKLVNEVSGDIAFDHLRTLTQFHVPNGATGDFMKEANWIAGKAKEYGLEDVRIIEMPFDGLAWTPKSAELWLVDKDGKETKLGSFEEVATSIADYSRPAKVDAELIDIGEGLSDRDYEGKDVKGKIVLASGSPATVEKEAVWKRGAIGIVSYYSSRITPSDYPDQIAWTRINEKPDAEGHQPSFAFVIAYRAGKALSRRLNPHVEWDQLARKSVEMPAEPLKVRVSIEADIQPVSKQHLVEGWIRGSKIHDQQIVLTAHIQEEKTSANDDRSGCANMLEIARAVTKMIREGKLQRPERDIRFWWTNEIDGPYDYFALHPDEIKNTFVNINQDMVGVNQTIGGLSRVQQVTRTPWSRPTFLNDVVESIVMSLYYGNNSYIAARQAQSTPPGSPYSRPIYSRLGSRDRYSVEITPFFNNTDAMPFNDGWTAAQHGGITFTNWPDEYIHSSADDMWQMDSTTFKRNAVAVTAIAWFMANAGAKEALRLVDITSTRGLGRITNDLGAVSERISANNAEWLWDQNNASEQSGTREHNALLSIGTVANPPSQELQTAIKGAVTQVVLYARSFLEKPDEVLPEEPERDLRARIPIRTASALDYRKKEKDLKRPKGLHALMAFEALNFIDGKRTVWDIYAACRAESLAGGEWYYGTVTPEAIKEYLDSAAKLGLITINPAPPPAAPAKKSPKKR